MLSGINSASRQNFFISEPVLFLSSLSYRLLAGFLFSCMVLSAYAKAADKVDISIDASKTGPPISKYIYGQFLEHIGGIVNNNIWAEMLDDRKFYYPINSH